MRANNKRVKVILRAVSLVMLVGLVIAPAFWVTAFGQGDRTSTEQSANANRSIGDGQKYSIEGIVTKRDDGEITVRAKDGGETVVVVTGETEIKTVRKGLFRRDRISPASEIVRGLRLTVQGTGNAEGKLVARSVRFNEQDLRTAEALDSRVAPVETLANSTQTLADSNQKRITDVEENAQKLSGQVDELSGVAQAATTAANRAQNTADQAQLDANSANDRISSLDDYDVLKTVTVQFKSGSAVLSSAAKASLDETAESVQNENFKGWVLAIVGYADATGNSARNLSLSQRRASAVINYLVTKHNLPMRRLVQPFGYGSDQPVASNDTRAGRGQNRRAEIRILVNRGIISQSGFSERSAVVSLANLPY